ncbi:Hypothetical protein D9617_11g008910 [Elsinoe fawcettii]|nr:Hypothetical protein D9617_11g008910 [Elsinoe fawcettii]
MATNRPVPAHNEFQVGCICPMGVELAPVLEMLDEVYQRGLPSTSYTCSYVLGRMGKHNIVIATLAETGNNSSATVATQLVNDFKSIRFGLLVGIGGGLPSNECDIRLGDVVVSRPLNGVAAVVQLDRGKYGPDDYFLKVGHLDPPPRILMDAITWLEAHHKSHESTISDHVDEILRKKPKLRSEGYSRPSTTSDLRFEDTYIHTARNLSCKYCDHKRLVTRGERSNGKPRIFYGPIGSSNAVIKDASLARRYREQGFLCVEMEAAGIMDNFRCLVIRGVCDYADSHKCKDWQPYAAAAAAGYMKELLSHIKPAIVEKSATAQPPEFNSLNPVVTRNGEDYSQKIRVEDEMVATTLQESEVMGEHKDKKPGQSPARLRRMMGKLGKVQQIWHVPVSLPSPFVDQGHIAAQLKRVCLSARASQLGPRPQVASVYGAPGAGKSTACLKFANEHRQRYTAVFWIDASSSQKIEKQMQHICDRHVPKDFYNGKASRTFVHWLRNLRNSWLLILDGVDDSAIDITSYLPISAKGTILISSRNAKVRQHSTLGTFDVPPLNPSEACELFLAVAKKCDPTTRITALEATKLSSSLGHSPLAIIQAANYVGKGLCTVAAYPNQLKRHPSQMLRRCDIEGARYHHDAAYAIFEASVDYVKSSGQSPENVENALELLRIFGFMHSEKISEKMFRDAGLALDKLPISDPPPPALYRVASLVKSCRRPAAAYVRNTSMPSESRSWNPQPIREAMQLLASHSLLTKVNGSFDDISISPILHLWMFARMNKCERQENFRKTCWTLSQSIGLTTSDYHQEQSQTMLNHILACLDCPNIELDFLKLDESDLEVIVTLLQYVSSTGTKMISQRLALKWAKIIEGSLQPKNRAGVAMMDLLVWCHDVRCLRTKAMEAAEVGAKYASDWYGEYSFEHVSRLSRLAQQYALLGRYHDAIAVLEPQAKAKRLSALPTDKYAAALDVLAWSYFRSGSRERAIELQIYADQRLDDRTNPQQHPSIEPGFSLCQMYLQSGRKTDYVQLAEFLYNKRKNQYGDSSCHTLKAMRLFAEALCVLGYNYQAEDLLGRCIAAQKVHLGAQHEETIRSRHQMSLLLISLRRWNESVEIAKDCWQALSADKDASQDLTAQVLETLIFCSAMTGSVSYSISVLRQSWLVRRSCSGLDPATLVDNVLNHTLALYSAGATTSAHQFFERALTVCEEILLPGWHSLAILSQSLDVYLRRNEDSIVDPALSAILARFLAVKSLQDRNSHARSVQEIAQILTDNNRWAAAIQIWKYAYELRLAINGPDHHLSQDLYHRYAVALSEWEMLDPESRQAASTGLPDVDRSEAIVQNPSNLRRRLARMFLPRFNAQLRSRFLGAWSRGSSPFRMGPRLGSDLIALRLQDEVLAPELEASALSPGRLNRLETVLEAEDDVTQDCRLNTPSPLPIYTRLSQQEGLPFPSRYESISGAGSMLLSTSFTGSASTISPIRSLTDTASTYPRSGVSPMSAASSSPPNGSVKIGMYAGCIHPNLTHPALRKAASVYELQTERNAHELAVRRSCTDCDLRETENLELDGSEAQSSGTLHQAGNDAGVDHISGTVATASMVGQDLASTARDVNDNVELEQEDVGTMSPEQLTETTPLLTLSSGTYWDAGKARSHLQAKPNIEVASTAYLCEDEIPMIWCPVRSFLSPPASRISTAILAESIDNHHSIKDDVDRGQTNISVQNDLQHNQEPLDDLSTINATQRGDAKQHEGNGPAARQAHTGVASLSFLDATAGYNTPTFSSDIADHYCCDDELYRQKKPARPRVALCVATSEGHGFVGDGDLSKDLATGTEVEMVGLVPETVATTDGKQQRGMSFKRPAITHGRPRARMIVHREQTDGFLANSSRYGTNWYRRRPTYQENVTSRNTSICTAARNLRLAAIPEHGDDAGPKPCSEVDNGQARRNDLSQNPPATSWLTEGPTLGAGAICESPISTLNTPFDHGLFTSQSTRIGKGQDSMPANINVSTPQVWKVPIARPLASVTTQACTTPERPARGPLRHPIGATEYLLHVLHGQPEEPPIPRTPSKITDYFVPMTPKQRREVQTELRKPISPTPIMPNRRQSSLLPAQEQPVAPDTGSPITSSALSMQFTHEEPAQSSAVSITQSCSASCDENQQKTGSLELQIPEPSRARSVTPKLQIDTEVEPVLHISHQALMLKASTSASVLPSATSSNPSYFLTPESSQIPSAGTFATSFAGSFSSAGPKSAYTRGRPSAVSSPGSIYWPSPTMYIRRGYSTDRAMEGVE